MIIRPLTYGNRKGTGEGVDKRMDKVVEKSTTSAIPPPNAPRHHFILYRADIDGLRAVAVLCVVFYHAMPTALRGGFIGVDVFFVISGYLISGQIFAELRERRFHLAAFYGRRIRRIFPALILVLAATLAYGFVVLLPSELASLGADVAGGAGFVSNLMLWHEAGYFDRAAMLKPLLHLWSLGVEEQFYIFWPALLWAARRFGLFRYGLLMLLTAASLLAGILLAMHQPTADFYAPFTRFWELSAGALLAWTGTPENKGRGADARSVLGLLLILGSAVSLNAHLVFPGGWAMMPVLGAVSLISAGPQAWVNRVLLSRRAFTFTGKVSYPFYLWHWPLISYAYLLDNTKLLKTAPALGIVVVSFLLAVGTYYGLERPLRFGQAKQAKSLWLAAAMLAMGSAGALVWGATGFPGRYSSLSGVDAAKINVAIHDGMFNSTPHMRVIKIDGITVGELGDTGSAVMLTGDSLMFHWDARVEQLLDEGRLKHRVYFVVGPSCRPVPGITYAPMFAGCANLAAVEEKVIREEGVGTIVVGAFWQGTFGAAPDDPLYGRLQTELSGWVQQGHAVYLILPLPGGTNFDPARMVTRRLTGVTVNQAMLNGVAVAALQAERAPMAARLTEVAHSSGARTLDPLPDICGRGPICSPLFADGAPKFVDDKHLRPVFVKTHIIFLDSLLTR